MERSVFRIEASKVAPTATGEGHRPCVLELTVDGTILVSVRAIRVGDVEGAPDIGGESTRAA